MHPTAPPHLGMPRRVVVALVAVVLLVAPLAAVLWSSPARAHGAEGKMTITKVEQVGPDQVRVEAGLTYANDADLATEATVTATFTGPGGTSVGPTPLAREAPNSSLYAATVTLPAAGAWAVQVTSEGPAASATGAVSISSPTESTATTAAPGTTIARSTVPTTAPATTAPVTVAGTSSSDDGGSSAGVVVALVLAAVVVVGAVGFVLARRRSST